MTRTRMHVYAVLFAALCIPLCPSLLYAQEDSPAAAPAMTMTMSGSHEFDYHQSIYGSGTSYEGQMLSPALRNELGIELREGDLKLVSRWSLDILQDRFSSDSARSGYSDGQLGSWDSLARLRPLENYIAWSPAAAGLKLAFGYQIFAWGVADKVNPTDNLNPRDYTVGIIDPDKIPVLAVDVIAYPTDTLSAEAVFVPFEQPDVWPSDFAQSVQNSTGFSPVTYDSLSYSLKSFVAGGRLSYRTSAIDLSASYLYDIDPYYSPDISGSLYPPSGTISLERTRIHRLGADAKTTLGAYGLWLEACYSITDRPAGDDARRLSRVDYVAGCDFNYGPNDTFYVNVQYLGTVIPGYNHEALNPARAADIAYNESFYERLLANSLGMETEGLIQGISLDLSWALFDSRLTPRLIAVYTLPFLYDNSKVTRYGSFALNPEIDLMPVDSFHILVGADLAYALYTSNGSTSVQMDTTGDRIGVFTPFNNVYIKVCYKWNYALQK